MPLLFFLSFPRGTCISIAQAQSRPPATLTVDAETLITQPLHATFRIHPGDNPAFASPTFDDILWPQLTPGQSLPAPGPGPIWLRLHLHILHPTRRVGIAITPYDWLPYTVFVNGDLVAESPGAPQQVRQRNPPFAIALPETSEITVAIRFLDPGPVPVKVLPIDRIDIGPLHTLTAATDLARIRAFDSRFLTGFFAVFIFFAFVPFILVLFLAQRDHPEYLCLAIFFVFCGVFTLIANRDDAGLMPETFTAEMLYQYVAWGAMIASLEFIARFALVKRLRPLRILQAAMLVLPLFYLGNHSAYGLILVGGLIVWLTFIAVYLLGALRRGRTEAGLLLVPFVAAALVQVYDAAVFFFPRIPAPHRLHLGHVGFTLDDLSYFVFISGILAVVLYRFIRVSRDEQHAAAEFEAARTVQQVLIPEEAPAIPGYTIASVYQPAQQVSGDFFQILPSPNVMGDSLVLLGDVSGKGLQAAMTVAVIVGAARTFAEYTQCPAELMAGLNRRLHGRTTGFTTCIILRVRPSGHITAANAGHLPPYLRGAELALEPGLPLGLTAEAIYPETTFTLAPGEALTLLTDGVVEATNPATRELFGFPRTLEVSRQTPEIIAHAATRFGQPAPQADDITVLTLTRRPSPHS